MNAEELKKAREICDKASYGNWEEHGCMITCDIKANGKIIHIKRICETPNDAEEYEMSNRFNDMEFIAFARTALPAALDEIERLQKENAKLKADANK